MVDGQNQQAQINQAQQFAAQAEVAYSQDQFAESIALCRKALQIKPDWAEPYVTMGNALQGQGEIDDAIRCYSQALTLNPNLVSAHVNLGSMLYKQGRLTEATINYRKALSLQPNLAAIHWNLAQVLHQEGKLEEAKLHELKALELEPKLGGFELQIQLGYELAKQGKLEAAVTAWQRAIEMQPNKAEPYCQIGILRRRQGKNQEAIPLLKQAIALEPNLAVAHQHLCGILRDTSDLKAARQAVNDYVISCGEIDPIMTAIYSISTHQVSGLNQIAKERFLELELKLKENFGGLVKIALELKALYANFLFGQPYLRDDLIANSALNQTIANYYVEKILKPTYQQQTYSSKKTQPKNLKIGFISNHFTRHSIGWCSADIIRELGQITPHIYLYNTDYFKPDDRTQKIQSYVTKFYQSQNLPNGLVEVEEIIKEIKQDQIDVLIDLDSLSVPVHAEILYYRPAPICISWLGFEAPYISEENYFLCDRHTHPPDREKYYQEKLLRMPESFAAVSGFQRKIAEYLDLRKTYRLSPEQIVFLCVAPGRKFNQELAQAQIEILRQIPNSVLIHKALGDIEVFKKVYYDECQKAGISSHRVKFIDRFATEEEHRNIYILADVLLDSYPYNGGTHTLEALWFNLPVVTRCGEQFLSRMGYSFLQAVGLQQGIAKSWEEYIQWGVKLGQNLELRKAIATHLETTKEPGNLAPLWNPKKFAQDLYKILEQL